MRRAKQIAGVVTFVGVIGMTFDFVNAANAADARGKLGEAQIDNPTSSYVDDLHTARTHSHSAVVLRVQSPGHGIKVLVYRPGVGWRFGAPIEHDAPRKKKAATATIGASQDSKSAVETPMTVFIDGPSGYTYVWSSDKGWKFVGRLETDRQSD